jgi:hypothetical protein
MEKKSKKKVDGILKKNSHDVILLKPPPLGQRD